MGGSVSTVYEANGSSIPLRNKKGRVIAFHSSSKWKLHFESSKQASKLIVIDFTASWCGPCQSILPAVNEFAQKYTDVEFIKIDVDELDDIAREFSVQAMPTFILIKKGKEVDKVVGAKQDELQKKIEIDAQLLIQSHGLRPSFLLKFDIKTLHILAVERVSTVLHLIFKYYIFLIHVTCFPRTSNIKHYQMLEKPFHEKA